MNGCERLSSGEVELYFYDELDAHERASVERHVKGCAECHRALDDLSTIRAALSTRPVVSAPANGDWSAFMAKLDAAIHVERATARIVPFAATAPAVKPRAGYFAPLAVAALVTLAAMSAAYVIRSQHRSAATTESAASARQTPAPEAVVEPATQTPAASPAAERTPEAAFAALSEQHFERSKLVVLGLANKDASRARVSDWEYERQLASTLLSDTRLYRVAAEDRGYTALAKVMADLELVLLQTSASERPASADLQQIQRLIAKRDLVTKMDVVTAAGL
jgi:hypothetical protein